MKNRIYHAALLLVVLLTGCYRDDLCFDHPTGARIQLNAHYSEGAGLAPDKSYVGIYNADNGNLIREELMTNPTQHNLNLEVGRYLLMVYNEPLIEDEFTTTHSVEFSEKSPWSTFKAFAANNPSQPSSSSGSERHVHNIQDQLAVGRIMELEITQDMVEKHHIHPTPEHEAGTELTPDTILHVYPRRVFTKVNVDLIITYYPGWTLRRNNGSRPFLYGAADVYMMGTDSYAATPTTQYVDFVNNGNFLRSLKPTTKFTSSFYMVGLQNNTMPTSDNGHPYTLFFRFESGSAASPQGVEIRPVTVNLVTGENAESVVMTHTRAGQPRLADGKTYHNDVLDIELQIELPERVPIGEDAEVDIEDWGEQDVPLDGPPTLYFHPNGATGTTFGWRYPTGTLLFLPAPTTFTAPNGYRFKEWNISNDGIGKGYQPSAAYPMPAGGTTLFAIWEKMPPVP